MDLTTKERVKVHGEGGGQKWGTSSDAQLDAIIAGYSADFQLMLDRAVLAAAQTETFDVDRGQRVFSLKAYPVTAVTSIINDTERLFTGSALAATDYSLNTATGLLQVQAYLLPGPGIPMPVFAIHGSVGPDDLTALLDQTPIKGAKLAKGKNGRYTIADSPLPFLMILGDEAPDVPAGVVLAGLAPMLTDKFVASMGKSTSATIDAMLAKVDTTAHIWGCFDVPEGLDDDAPAKIYGSMNVTGDKPLNVSLVFAEQADVDKMMKDYEEAPDFVKEIFALKCDGKTVAITMIGKGGLIDNLVKLAMQGMLGQTKESEEPTGPAQ